LEKALANDPLSTLILFDIGKSEMYLGHPEKTLEHAASILEIDPSSVYGYGGKLQAHLVMGHLDLALPSMIKMMDLDSSDFENWAYMAMWWEMLGEPDIADAYLTRALELGPQEPTVLKCSVQISYLRGDFAAATRVADQALQAQLDNRWFSDRIFLRQIRDSAIANGDMSTSLGFYRDRHPELFSASPDFSIDNVNAAADLALLLMEDGQLEMAKTLTDSGLDWYEQTRPTGVYSALSGIVAVDFLALQGDKNAALEKLKEAVEGGWIYSWPWYINSPNLDSIRGEPEFQTIVMQLQNNMTTQHDALMALPDMGEFDLRD
jgi:tetratricopeptide (TPR) repeat protein